MVIIASIWGILGVLAILGCAVFRLFPIALAAFDEPSFGLLEWIVLIVWMAFMIFAEGIKGFHKAFSPRVVARARALKEQPHPVACILAPFYCFGFFHATRKRKIVSWSVAMGIVVLILSVRLLSQPWRGIIDSGVVVGLGIGMLSIIYYTLRWILGFPINYPPDLPEKKSV